MLYVDRYDVKSMGQLMWISESALAEDPYTCRKLFAGSTRPPFLRGQLRIHLSCLHLFPFPTSIATSLTTRVGPVGFELTFLSRLPYSNYIRIRLGPRCFAQPRNINGPNRKATMVQIQLQLTQPLKPSLPRDVKPKVPF